MNFIGKPLAYFGLAVALAVGFVVTAQTQQPVAPAAGTTSYMLAMHPELASH